MESNQKCCLLINVITRNFCLERCEDVNLAKEVFADCGMGITAEGKRHLGAAIGSQGFVE